MNQFRPVLACRVDSLNAGFLSPRLMNFLHDPMLRCPFVWVSQFPPRRSYPPMQCFTCSLIHVSVKLSVSGPSSTLRPQLVLGLAQTKAEGTRASRVGCNRRVGNELQDAICLERILSYAHAPYGRRLHASFPLCPRGTSCYLPHSTIS
jgi:hypothetical protein